MEIFSFFIIFFNLMFPICLTFTKKFNNFDKIKKKKFILHEQLKNQNEENIKESTEEIPLIVLCKITLQTKQYRNEFKNFCKKEFSTENIDCFEGK
jgi:uncharacterized membrane protein required for colicin V production